MVFRVSVIVFCCFFPFIYVRSLSHHRKFVSDDFGISRFPDPKNNIVFPKDDDERFSDLEYVFNGDHHEFNPDDGNNEIENVVRMEDDNLVLLHVLFRHGNRTADSAAELYPLDPYLNETYFPYGLGQLTNAGKRREFSIGTTLRNRYGHYLGEHYYPEIVEAQSSDYNRTKMSLQLVLAGLFPPTGEQEWKDYVQWQPVPYNYLPRSQDKVLLGVLCPRYLTIYDQVINSRQMRNEFKNYHNLFHFISKNTGLNITKFQDVYNLYFGLATEEEFGYKLPSWTNTIWPHIIREIAMKEYFVATATKEMHKLASGYFLQKVLDDTRTKIQKEKNENGKHEQQERKIHLYSGHENNIAELLMLLGVFEEPHIPNYGAYIVIEVRKVRGVYGIKFYYQNYENNGPQLLRIKDCEEFCPLERFSNIVSEFIPSKNLCGNSSEIS